MTERKNYHHVVEQLTEYYENTKVPKTLNKALMDLGHKSGNTSHLLKRLRQDFPDEMRDVENSHYCIPSSSQGAIIRGYFFVRYRDQIVKCIEDDLRFDEIYEILMKDPRNACINMTKKEWMSHIYYFANNGCSPEITKAYNARGERKLSRLEEIYKDVMASKPNTYNVQSLCEKYKISKTMVYLFIKHTTCGNKLMNLLDYTEYTCCNTRSHNLRLIEEMKQEGFDTEEISDKLGISEGYIKYALRSLKSIDNRLLKKI